MPESNFVKRESKRVRRELPTSSTTQPLSFEDQLRYAILGSEHSQYELARRAGIVPGVIYRFMSGDRGMSFAALASLWEVLGLELQKRA